MVNTEKEKHHEITTMDQKSIHSTVLPRSAGQFRSQQKSTNHSGCRALDPRIRTTWVVTMKKFSTAVWEFFEAWGEYRYQMARRRGWLYY